MKLDIKEQTIIVLLVMMALLVVITAIIIKGEEHKKVETYTACLIAGATEAYCAEMSKVEDYTNLRHIIKGGK